ncbi:MAG: C40 family peptidase, partial [Eubacterium sp.]|nr:C40 family peptidase [Eubacterium sp.]
MGNIPVNNVKKLICGVAVLAAIIIVVPTSAAVWYTTDSVRLRKEPSRSSDILNTVGPDTEVEVYGFEGEWADAFYEGMNGYICKDYLTSSAKEAKKAAAKIDKKEAKESKKSSGKSKKETPQGVAKINGSDVNFRKKPKGKILNQLDKGEKVTVYSSKGDWTKVRIADGTIGYVYTSYIGDKISRSDQIERWKDAAVRFCDKNLGAKYSQDKRDQEGYFDCSSLMRDAFREATGEFIGETTDSQSDLMKDYLYKINVIYDADYGDILYHLSGDDENHCGIYLGDGQVLSASQTAGKVKIKTYEDWSNYWEYGCKAAAYC